MSASTNSKTIVFIHGLFMNPASWDTWIKYFEEKGYKCYAPAYPFHEGEPSELRTSINPNLGMVTFGQVISSLSEFIDKLPERPILIGHSMGGLAVQKLIEMKKGLPESALTLHRRKEFLVLNGVFLRANLPTINPLKGNSVYLPGIKWFNYAFCNTMSMEQTEIEFNKFVVPESRNIARSSTKMKAKLILKKPHDPLLIIAGEKIT